MGVIIQALSDGFRRGGIAHSAEATYYPDGYFTNEQLDVFLGEPQLVVIDQAEPGQPVGVGGPSPDLAEQMRETIAGLRHDVVAAQNGRQNAEGELMAIAIQLDDVAELIVSDITALPAEDPTAEGVLSISIQEIQRIVLMRVQQVVNPGEGQAHASDSTFNGPTGSAQASPDSAASAATSPAPGADKPVKGKGSKARHSADDQKEAGE